MEFSLVLTTTFGTQSMYWAFHCRETCAGDSSQPCFNGCFPSPSLPSSENYHSQTAPKSTNHDFALATCSTLQPNTGFTNHEALPSLQDCYLNFTKAFPQFSNTLKADQIRDQEYYHLNLSNTRFDYTGYGLFSYAQRQRSCPTNSVASSSSNPPSLPCSASESPFFSISYKSVSLHSQMLYGGEESELETKMRERVMAFMNVSESDYSLVFTANQISAFKLLADSFQFQSNGNLLTAYDHHSEAADVMIESCKKQGAYTLSAEFWWPSLRIQSKKLKKMIMSKREKRKRGLFVYPLQSRVSGAPYSYIWMTLAQENGWHVLLDACALGAKDMDTLGLSFFKPDFLVCSFYNIFGKDPSGFGCLFVKKSSISVLKDSANSTSIGIVSIVPPFTQPKEESENSPPHGIEQVSGQQKAVSVSSGESSRRTNRSVEIECRGLEESENSPPHEIEKVSGQQKAVSVSSSQSSRRTNRSVEIECRGLEHADSLGLIVISSRTRYLINWLVNALMSLEHPHPDRESGISLIKIYGPKINLHRGAAVAFNVFDWKGERIEAGIVQKLADRHNISLSCGVLKNLRFSENKEREESQRMFKKTYKHECGVSVVTAAIGMLTNFEDTYKLWAFLSRFLDADFVEKERWRYMALNQKTIEI